MQNLFYIILLGFLLVACESKPELKPVASYEPNILIVNSDKSINKYSTIQSEFEKAVNIKTFAVDFAGRTISDTELKGKINAIKPKIIYTIGVKAYIQVSKVAANIPTIFSSMINWRRFEMQQNNYGISLELPVEMPLFMYSYLFPDINNIGVLYSKQYNSQWFKMAVIHGKEVVINLHGKEIEETTQIDKILPTFLNTVDAIWLISDPTVLHNTKQVENIFRLAAEQQKPIFAYNTIFTKYGATLAMAADIPTMGRQAAGLSNDLLKQQDIDEKVQFPAGSHIIFNLKKAEEYGIKVNRAALFSVEKVIQ